MFDRVSNATLQLLSISLFRLRFSTLAIDLLILRANLATSEVTSTFSKSAKQTLEKDVKYVQS